jgi:alkanesulfonate monooxygenase SsuD/methylene tetrahydromethanopterin reductase-like flavin-dependent oxidoreductase (luciferase family)
MRFGACFWMQRTDWRSLSLAWQAADRAGFDSLWTEDHLLADLGDWRWPKYEGWAALAALAPLAESARVGILVTAVAFRNPGHVAKLATTLDHISDGRLILGLGAGHFQREHEAFGYEFGPTDGARLGRLDEAAGLIRRLLDGETVTHSGRYYQFVDAVCEPRPIQGHLPILIGGNGPQRTMRIAARHADIWNGFGDPPEAVGALASLRARCAEADRNFDSLQRSIVAWGCLRDTAADAYRAHRDIRAANGLRLTRDDGSPIVPPCVGSPSEVAAAVRAYADAGVQELMWHFLAPFDTETIGRLGDLREELAGG